MSQRRARLVISLVVPLGLGVMAAALVVSKDRVLQWWYLRRLEQLQGEKLQGAIEKLGEVGQEEALIALLEHETRLWPTFINGMPIYSRNPAKRNSRSLTGRREMRDQELEARLAHKAWSKIGERIGKARKLAARVRYMRDSSRDLRTRISCAVEHILLVTSGDQLSGVFEGLLQGRPQLPADQLGQWLAAKPVAIRVCIEALASQDLALRGGAVFILTFCGGEASDALPLLEELAHDPDEYVRGCALKAAVNIRARMESPPRE